MRVEVYQPDRHREKWEAFVGRQARNGHFMHSRRFLEYHGERFQDHSLLLFGSGDEPVAVLPAARDGAVLRSHHGLSFGGLLVGGRFRLADWREAFVAIGSHLREGGMEKLDYRPTPPWYHSSFGEDDVFLLESAGEKPDLAASAICRMGTFQGNASRRSDLKGGALVERDDSSLAEVMKLVEATVRDRHGADLVHSVGEMELLSGLFPDGIRCYTARAGELLAALVVFVSEAAVKLQYVGYTDGAAASAIYAHLFELEEFRDRWFDFGTSTANDGGVDGGLFAYKESLGGRTANVRRYEIGDQFASF